MHTPILEIIDNSKVISLSELQIYPMRATLQAWVSLFHRHNPLFCDDWATFPVLIPTALAVWKLLNYEQ